MIPHPPSGARTTTPTQQPHGCGSPVTSIPPLPKVTELSDAQLDGLAGGVTLRTELIYTENAQFETNRSGKRHPAAREALLQVLSGTADARHQGLVTRLFESLGLMRRTFSTDDDLSYTLGELPGEAGGAMKMASYLFDQTHECLMSLAQFCGKNMASSVGTWRCSGGKRCTWYYHVTAFSQKDRIICSKLLPVVDVVLLSSGYRRTKIVVMSGLLFGRSCVRRGLISHQAENLPRPTTRSSPLPRGFFPCSIPRWPSR